MVLFWVLLRTFESYVLSSICSIFTPKLGEDFPIVTSMLVLNGLQNCFLYVYWIPIPDSILKIVVQMDVSYWLHIFRFPPHLWPCRTVCRCLALFPYRRIAMQLSLQALGGSGGSRTLLRINISHLWKRKIIFPATIKGDMWSFPGG